MRFSLFHVSRKAAAFVAALAIVPMAVACDTTSVDTADTPDVEAPVEEPVADATEPATEAGETIVDVASSNGSFNTLVAAIEAAGLVETLSGEGPFTVFAPTDEAFEALPEGVLDQLLLPENQEVLASILQYHVVSGEVMSGDVVTGAVASVEGADLDLVAENGAVTVNEATVTEADIAASNGVIHVINSVLVPPSVDVSAL